MFVALSWTSVCLLLEELRAHGFSTVQKKFCAFVTCSSENVSFAPLRMIRRMMWHGAIILKLSQCGRTWYPKYLAVYRKLLESKAEGRVAERLEEPFLEQAVDEALVCERECCRQEV